MIKTVVRWENFIPKSWWCKCCLSGSDIGFLFTILLSIAKAVSSIGIASKKIGTINEVNVTFFYPSNAITAIIYPKNIEPESPIKIEAG